MNRAARQRVIVGLDQGVSSLTNMAAMAVMAGMLAEEDWSAVSLASLAFISALVLVRAAVGEATLLGAVDRNAALASAFVVGCLIALCMLGVAVVLGGPVATLLTIAAFGLPGASLQEAHRSTSICANRAGQALASDMIWLLGSLACFAVAAAIGRATPTVLLGGWLASSTLAVVGWPEALKCVSHFRVGVESLVETRSIWFPATADAGLSSGTTLVNYMVLAAVAGISSAGAVRGAYLLFGPLVVLSLTMVLVIVPWLGRRKADLDQVRHAVYVLTAALVIVFGSWGVITQLMPERLGRTILGETWEGASDLLLLVSGVFMAGVVGLPSQFALRALGLQSRLFRLRVRLLPVAILLPAVGSFRGSDGYLVALGLVAAIVSVSTASMLIAATRSSRS